MQGSRFDRRVPGQHDVQFRQDNPDIGMDSNGDFVVVWQSDQQDGNMWGIFGQRFTATGAKAGSEFAVNTYTLDKQILPAVDMDAAGDFVVTWESFDQDGSTATAFTPGVTMPPATAKDSAEFRVNQTTLNWQVTPDVGMADNGDFTITWSSFGQDNVDSSNSSPTSDYGIYARMYKADGSDYVSPTTSHALGEFRVNAAPCRRSDHSGDQRYSVGQCRDRLGRSPYQEQPHRSGRLCSADFRIDAHPNQHARPDNQRCGGRAGQRLHVLECRGS